MQTQFIDMHCDSLLKLLDGGSLYDNPENMLDVIRMIKAGQAAQFFAIFFPPRDELGTMTDDELFQKALEKLRETQRVYEREFRIAYDAEEICRNKKKGVVSAVLTIEDGRAVNGEMEKLSEYYEAGVRAMTLTWNDVNCFGYPNSDNKSVMKSGLTSFGKEAVAEMNRLGMIIDVSHLSDGGFWDVVSQTKKPFAATHSNCRAICNHKRNLSDEMIKALADRGGVIGVNYAPEFLTSRSRLKSRTEDIIRHTEHIIDTGGEETAALGSDFDGIHGDLEIGEPGEVIKLFEALMKAGISERVIEKIAYKNVIRMMSEVMKRSDKNEKGTNR